MVTIKDIYPICTAPEGIPLVIVKVVTSEPGLYGIGCATYTQRWMTVAHAVTNYMKPLLVGKDVTRIEDIWQMSMVSAYWRNGPVLNNAISGVDEALWDIKGKKLGFEGGGLRFETMQALGASVVGMNMSDLYQAMQGGIIDGIVMDFDPLISRRYGEEVKHVTLLNITGTAFYVVMNQERYDSLPDDLKAIVDDMSQNYGPNLLEKFWAENVYGSLDKGIKEMGGTVYVLSDEDYARADKLAAVPAQAWFKSLDKAGYRGAELEKTFHQLEAKYFTPWRQSEAYRYVKQQ